MTEEMSLKISEYDSFEEYLSLVRYSSPKLNYSYIGINKKEYPKWEGWKIISTYKDIGVPASEIYDEKLDVLVLNFYYLKYITGDLPVI